MKENKIKTFDMRSMRMESVNDIKKLDDALINFGLFCLVGHDIDSSNISRLRKLILQFFYLDSDQKLKYFPSEKIKNRGFLPLGIESVAATNKNITPPDLVEALVFSYGRRGDLNNFYPYELENIESVINEYRYEIDKLGRELLKFFAIALNIDREYFLNYYKNPQLSIRFVHYPEQDAKNILPEQMRYGSRTDYGGLTILAPDPDHGGLQVCDNTGVWYDVQCPDDGVVINCGDLLSYWTNGRWKSALHRVKNPVTQSDIISSRLSIVSFYDPDKEAHIKPLEKYNKSSENCGPIIAGEYIYDKIIKSMGL